MIYLDDKNIDYEKVKSFDLFIMLYQDMIQKYETIYKPRLTEKEYETLFNNNPYLQAFKFFLNKDNFIVAKDEDGNTVIGDCDTNTVMINEEVYSYISKFIKLINGINEGERINPEDEFAKQILIEDERNRLKKLAKNKDGVENNRLGNLISAITWGTSGGITPFNRNQLHMYDLVDGIKRTDKLLNFKYTMTGLYSGCVDRNKIDFNEINWQS
jgi:hypothetical protein